MRTIEELKFVIKNNSSISDGRLPFLFQDYDGYFFLEEREHGRRKRIPLEFIEVKIIFGTYDLKMVDIDAYEIKFEMIKRGNYDFKK